MCKGECSTDNFFFSNVEPWRLYSPEYTSNKGWNIFYLVWRWINALFFLASLIESPLVPQRDDPIDRAKWLIYLTNWTAIVYTLGQVWNASVSTAHYVNTGFGPTESEVKDVRWYLKVNWILYTISLGASCTVSVMYWTLLHTGVPEYDDVVFHTAHAVVLLLIDMWITAMPLRLLHFYLVILFGLMWVVFSVIFEVCGGISQEGTPNVYDILDWTENPAMSAALSLGAAAGAAVFSFIGFGLYKLRIRIYSGCLDRNDCYV